MCQGGTGLAEDSCDQEDKPAHEDTCNQEPCPAWSSGEWEKVQDRDQDSVCKSILCSVLSTVAEECLSAWCGVKTILDRVFLIRSVIFRRGPEKPEPAI